MSVNSGRRTPCSAASGCGGPGCLTRGTQSNSALMSRLGQLDVGADLGMRYESGGELLYSSVQRGLLEAMGFAAMRGAIWHPLGLPAENAHYRLPRGSAHGLKPCSMSQSLRGCTAACSLGHGLPLGVTHCSERQLQGDKLAGADVGRGSGVPVRQRGQRSFRRPRWASALGMSAAHPSAVIGHARSAPAR